MLQTKPQTENLFKRVNDLLYEDPVFEPLGEDFFREEKLPGRERLLHFRLSQLNTPIRLILDLCLLENFPIPKVAKWLQISENMLEPFLFSLFHTLAGDIEIQTTQSQNTLELFRRSLAAQKQSSISKTEDEFSRRTRRLASFFSQDIRNKLSQKDLHLILSHRFPNASPSAEAPRPATPSVIASIRAENQTLHSTVTTPTHIAKSAKPQSRLKLAKAAAFILGVFLCLAAFRTLSPLEEGPQTGPHEKHTQSLSLQQLRFRRGAELGELELESELRLVYRLDKIEAPAEGARIELKSGIILELSGGSKVRVHHFLLAELIWGEVSIFFPKEETPFTMRSTHGEIQSSGKNLRFARWSREFSVAGVRRGSLLASRGEERVRVQEGQEIRLGKGLPGRPADYSSSSFLKKAGRRIQIHSSSSFQRELLPVNSEYEDESLRERISLPEQIKSAPSITQKDFHQKL